MRFTLVLLFFTFGISNFAQQDPLFASEGQRSFWFNPASIGTLNLYSANIIGRKQWMNVDGSPVSLQLNGSKKFFLENRSNQVVMVGAVGLNYMHDHIGFSKMHGVSVPINTQFLLGKNILSIGISPGFQTRRFSDELIITPSPGPDPVLPIITGISETQFTMGAGLHWYNHKFSLGFSSTHLFEERFNEINLSTVRHYYFNGSYKQRISNKFSLKGLLVGRAADSFYSVTGLIFAQFGAKNNFDVGLGYRNGGALIGAITKRFGRFYGGYFIEYYNSILSNGDFSHEFRFAFELFDYHIGP